ncbi:hypothetical protein AAG570_012320 [Ranatra chinensis]|uniref:Chorein N-terminal domain-containing protein n=1 Tax=Ranatra chinensis TaxID=642074 RepID=A0ABD0Z0P6_9HEMI
MLEGLAAWVINNYLGKYVENLNTDQLSIALLQGAVELENLPLKKDALRRVGLPIQVKAGVIGKVKLKVPVSQITTAPWELLMEQLYLIVGPIHPSERDEEAEEQALQEYKMSLLDSLEARWKSEQETFQDTNYYASSYSSWLGLSMSFATNIIENLQLKVKDVHLRYEDDATINGEMFAFGIKIDSLSAQSCDDAWIPRFLSCYNSSMSYKLLEMSGFSIYWDKMDKDTKWGDLDLYTLSGAMNTSDDIQHNYLMSPVCAKAQIKRNRSEHPLRSRTNPRIACDLILDQVSLSLAQWQYRQIVGCQKGLIKFSQSSVNGRPGISVKDSPRDWWKYAISRVMKPLPTWDTCRQRAKDNVAYVTIYTKTLINSSSPLSPENKLFKENFEWKTSFEDLQTLREIAMSRVQPPPLAGKGVQRQGLSVLVNWFPQWWGWHSSTSPSAITTPSETSLSIEGQILDALADTVENNTLLKRDTVFGQFNFTLKQGTFILCEKTSDPVMELQFENVTANFESRPRNGRPSRNLPPGLAKLINQTSAEKDQPLFHLSYEYKPFGAATDFKWIADFFITAYQNYDPGLRHAAKQGYNAMKRKTKQQLLINWENLLCGHLNNRKTWDVELDISAPQIFLVEHFTDKNAVLCVVDFGKLHLTNLQKESLAVPLKKVDSKDGDEEDEAFQTPCSTPPGSEASDSLGLESPPNQAVDAKTLSELLLHNKLYDTYTVCLSDLQILVGRVKDNWKFAHLKGTSALHVLDRFNISLQVERRVVYTMDPQFPSLTISGNLPKLVVHVNEQKVQALRTLLVVVSGKGLISPLRSQENSPVSDTLLENGTAEGEFSEMDENLDTGAKLLMLQFSVDQMALEVQSRGRSIVELQVNGVKTSFMKRPYDTSLTLSVHGLLLVDALQTFGPDFELLVASHKHVGL